MYIFRYMLTIYFQCLLIIPFESLHIFVTSFYQVYLYNLVTQAWL